MPGMLTGAEGHFSINVDHPTDSNQYGQEVLREDISCFRFISVVSCHFNLILFNRGE